ncbi:hypothetical protein [Pseudomonas aeruginosa]|uniref:hypothetical protein n=1 Tax=Pseudomonas aeruginosa TaxID=287 RepID=UPI000D3C38D9|nr:hypothetical protein [Pseudomonas aeruginosa]MBA5326416.1 hypothetical protein [Pseudomonas aeruginosa]MBG5170234.1 hypothetical protein [Pseudomonas aeruginosa]MCC0374491.1 hypothetical protein [Pseudomonas aeruginosa]MCM8617580.1 hypothetical protein [Pseudomonas aeruginosa]MCM8721757.1 hypothetical protein [Pseudomonas aeruginosa]
MVATFINNDDEYFEYPEAKDVKAEGGKYVIYDANGSVLGSHQVDSIKEFTTTVRGASASTSITD